MTMQRLAVSVRVSMLMLFMASGVAAQNAETGAIRIGSRVRFQVDASRERLTGTLVAMDSTHLTLRTTEDFKISVASVRWPQVSTGIGTRRAAGAFFGGMAGAAAGVFIASRGPKPDLDPRPFAAVAGGALGGLIGLIAGSAKVERWEPISMNALITASRGGQ